MDLGWILGVYGCIWVDLGGSGVDLACILGSKIYRTSIENLSKIYRTSIENLSNIYRKSMDLGWNWGGSGVDLGWILGVSGCIWVDLGGSGVDMVWILGSKIYRTSIENLSKIYRWKKIGPQVWPSYAPIWGLCADLLKQLFFLAKMKSF